MHKLQTFTLAILLAGTSTFVCGQNGAVAGPTLGYVQDGAGAFRPILGIPGASFLGDRLELGFEATVAAVAPRQDYALAVAADGSVQLVDLGRGPLAVRALDGAAASPDRLVLSPGGRAVLLVNSAAGTAQVAKGLPGAPTLADIDLSALPGQPDVLAVSDDGAILAATANGLFLLVDGASRVVPSTGRITALTFAPDGKSAFAAGPGQLAAIDDVTGQPAWRLLTALGDDAGSPIGTATANRRVVLAFSGFVVIVDPDTGAATRLDCAGAVTALARLNGDSFRLGEVSADPMWIIDLGGSEPRLLFIPPVAPADEELTY